MTICSAIRSIALTLMLSLLAMSTQAAEVPGKWIRYGKTTVNANQQPTITLLNPIADAAEAKVATMIKDANGPIPLTIAVQFSQPAVSFYTVNARVAEGGGGPAATGRVTAGEKAVLEKSQKSRPTKLFKISVLT